MMLFKMMSGETGWRVGPFNQNVFKRGGSVFERESLLFSISHVDFELLVDVRVGFQKKVIGSKDLKFRKDEKRRSGSHQHAYEFNHVTG